MEQQQQDYLGMDTIVAALSGLSDPEFEEVCGRANAARAVILAEQQNAPNIPVAVKTLPLRATVF